VSGVKVQVRAHEDLRYRRYRAHSCWGHLLAAVLGHESTGIPPEAPDLLDTVVEIPLIGTGHRLNVAVTGSLVLYRLAGLV
jgi:tRNA G18 (ribose-2'-O)-methylase SpoU